MEASVKGEGFFHLKLFPMTCRSCGRTFECNGYCANLSSLWGEDWNKLSDKEREKIQNEGNDWKSPKVSVCTCDNCKNRLVDKDGKLCNNHCEPIEIKVEFT